MNKQWRHINLRIYLLLLPVAGVAVLIGIQLFNLVTIQGAHYRQLARKYSVRSFKVKAERGKIWSSDGQLLAFNVPKYTVWFDPVAMHSDKEYYAKVDALARGLSKYVGKDVAYWKKQLINRRKKHIRYLLIGRDLSYAVFNKIKNLPIFRKGRIKGGMVYEIKTSRSYPFGDLLRRTLGVSNDRIKYGIEGAYDDVLRGKDGERIKQKINSKYWKPVNDFNEVEPVNGKDLVLSIDMQFQDIAYEALAEQLKKYKADHGTVIIMDTHTGFVKAMVNLGKTKDGSYKELRNYAVYENYEPGSVFKSFTYLTMLEQEKADTNTVYTIRDNVYPYYDLKIRDAHQYETPFKMTFTQGLAHSSNIFTVALTDKFYRNNPHEYVDFLTDEIGLGRKLGLRIKGESTPEIPNPDDKKHWKPYKLGMMSYGYGVEFTPMQLLAYYNAFANGGTLYRPQFVKAYRNGDKIVKTFRPQVIQRHIASKKNLEKLRYMLRKVVTEGTAKNINSPYVKIAGKTGTTQTQYWTDNIQYIASFAGFFPYDKPQYSMIVVVHKPDKSIGYYGNAVAGTVFMRIAEQIQGLVPDTVIVKASTDENKSLIR